MEKNDLFFVTTAKDFDIDKMELHPHWKKDWANKCELVANKPDWYKRHIEMLLEITGFRAGIKVLGVGCGTGWTIIELANLGADCTGLGSKARRQALYHASFKLYGLVFRYRIAVFG